MAFTFTKATKQQAKARIALTGPAGAGKTWTALKLATALGQRVAVIDTEHGSASKYADVFGFDALSLDDTHPNNYVQAIRAAQDAGYDVVVIDSATHEWSGTRGCLALVDHAAQGKGGNNWAAWSTVTPLHNAFIEAIHRADMHVIATFRSKMDYIQTEDQRGKKVIQKVGMAAITREGAEYEFDVVGEMDLAHVMTITKTRCSALADTVIPHPGDELAATLRAWLGQGEAPKPKPVAAPTKPVTPPTEVVGQPTEPVGYEWPTVAFTLSGDEFREWCDQKLGLSIETVQGILGKKVAEYLVEHGIRLAQLYVALEARTQEAIPLPHEPPVSEAVRSLNDDRDDLDSDLTRYEADAAATEA